MTAIDWNTAGSLGSTLAGIGGAAAAIWAALIAREAIAASAKATRLNATFEHIREVEARVRAMRDLDAARGYRELLVLTENDKPLSPEAEAVEAFLNGFELLAFAMQRGDVDRELVRRFFANIKSGELLDYVRKYSRCCGCILLSYVYIYACSTSVLVGYTHT